MLATLVPAPTTAGTGIREWGVGSQGKLIPDPYSPIPVANAAARLDTLPAGRFYPETGYTLAPEFVAYFDRYGGVTEFGLPISAAQSEGGFLVQWTERQRLEWHPELAGTQHEVLLGLLGRELTRGLEGPSFQAQSLGVGNRGSGAGNDHKQPASDLRSPIPRSTFFEPTGHTVTEPFLTYWQQQGGLPIFGYPISALHKDVGGREIQWFERARFESHPDLPDPHKVLLGHLGREALLQRNFKSIVVEVGGEAVPDSSLQIGLAQGGESDDPTFFDNIRTPGKELGRALVRIDNVFNHYGIVSRGADGKLAFDWTRFDRVLDGIAAMNKEPFICLSYMPEVMSESGASRVEAPASLDEWQALVSATVRHVNIERKMGVRYWEVWNEPDQWSFWQSSYAGYLRLYAATVEAAVSVDPSVKIGGPGLGRFSADHLHELLISQAALGDKGRIDFISWHSYGRRPDEIAAQVREARTILEAYPQFKPELVISEFNVLQGGPNDTSANGATDTVEGAIAVISSIESMKRERLDQALVFGLKDGLGPKPFWGRWGILNFSGQPKPVYHALQAYLTRPPGMLPVTVRQGPVDGTLGVMAFGSPRDALILLWYTGAGSARTKIRLPSSYAGREYVVTLFDKDQNNPARTGDARVTTLGRFDAGDIVVGLETNSFLIVRSR